MPPAARQCSRLPTVSCCCCRLSRLSTQHNTPPEGVKAEAAYAKDGTLPDPTSTTNPEFQIVLALIKDGLARDPTKYTRMAKRCK